MNLSCRIKKMNSDLINQIYAGEVVESPAHAIKELMENSIDSGATDIEVNIIDDKGLHFCVFDNGRGISKQDLPLALEPHATSKTFEIKDLWNVHTLGFRGEALASLSSVSQLKLLSQHFEGSVCYGVESNFGKPGLIYESGSRKGTLVEVSNLFQNVPARLKFLKSDAAEMGKIKNQFKALSLSHPHISFKLKYKTKMLFFFPCSNQLERVQDVLGEDRIYENSYEDEMGHKVQVYFCSPEITAKRSHKLWFFAQSRCIQNKNLYSATMGAFRNYLMHGEYPIAVLFVSCPPSHIDVNVHPSKTEVKFAQPQKVYFAVVRALRDELKKAPWIQNWVGVKNDLDSLVKTSDSDTLNSLEKNSDKSAHFDSYVFGSMLQNQPHTKHSESQLQNALNKKSAPSSMSERTDSYSQEVFSKKHDLMKSLLDLDVSNSLEEPLWSTLEILGHARNTYILAQTKDAVLFIDQHAAHERVLFEKFMHQWKNKNFSIQNFLIPCQLKLEKDQIEGLKSTQSGLESLGLSVEFLNANTLNVLACPEFLKEKALLAGLEQMAIDIVENGGVFALEQKAKDVLATMACHSAIRSGDSMTLEEIKHLLKDMDNYRSSFCPHGRPVFVSYFFHKIDKDLGRII